MARSKLVTPVLKWVGGKRQLLEDIDPLLPKTISNYCEPFVGGGAVLFHLQPNNAIINDINPELINVYSTIQNHVEGLIEELKTFKNDAEYYYSVRDWDRNPEYYQTLSNIQRAARTIYLNKTCYNGLYRVNNAGEFNTPFGHYKNPNIVNEYVLRAVSKYFNDANIQMYNMDYVWVLQQVKKNGFVYLDPPYDPISSTSNFTGYAKGGFSKEDQIKLKKCCDELDKRGIQFMLSNSATEFIKDLYHDYDITIVKAKRAVNSVASSRGAVDEVIVRNYV